MFNPNVIFVRIPDMKIYKTTDPAIYDLVTRFIKLLNLIDANPKLLSGTLFYLLLLLAYLLGSL